MMSRMFDVIVKFRALLVIAMLVLTGLLAYICMSFVLYDEPNSWPPPNDSNVRVNNLMQEKFGGANLVTVQVTVKEGDILNPKTLEKVKRMTDKIALIWGNIPYNLYSIAAIRVRYLRGSDDLLENTILMETVPTTPEGLERIGFGIKNNPTILGTLVSQDFKSTIITADFRTFQPKGTDIQLPTTDPVKIYKEIMKIIEPENDKNHVVRAVGTPIIIGWVNSEGLPYIGAAFLIFALGVTIVLLFSLKRKRVVAAILSLGVLAIVWGFGLTIIISGHVIESASAFITPFFIIGTVSCHGVQFFRRFLYEEYHEGVDPIAALKQTVLELYKPIVVALATDGIAFFVLMFIPFSNVSVLGTITTLGFATVIVGFFTFLIPVTAMFPGRPLIKEKPIETKETLGMFEKFLNEGVRILVMPTRIRWVVLASVGIILAISLWRMPFVDVGQDNTFAIHNYLTRSWKSNSIYLMENEFKKKFKGIYPLSILITTREPHQLLQPEVLKKIDAFAAYLETVPKVAGTMHLPIYYKLMHRFMNADNPAYWACPDQEDVIGFYHGLYLSAEPGGFDGAIDFNEQKCPLYAYVEDTSHATVKSVYDAAKQYAETHFNDDSVKAEVGGGAIGMAMAFNKNIGKWLILTTLISTLAGYLVTWIMLRSFTAGIYLMLPLLVATGIWYFLIDAFGIEMNSNVTSSLAIAMGVGIDAEVYFLFRFREEFARLKNFEEALIAAFVKIRKALIFSNAALIIGCWALIPMPLYIGYVGFGMGLILLVCFLMSFILSPILWSVLKPKFLFRNEVEAKACSSEAAC